MKKIVCPRCGAVNLEKFVTFPHCAGCSALLPLRAESSSRVPDSILRRPLRVGFWMSLVGLALAGVVALSFSSSDPGEPRQLLVYGQAPRHIQVGDELVCRLSVESMRSDGREGGKLRDVSWQLARSVEREWRVVSVSPPPDLAQHRNGRPYWLYRAWPADERWSVRLQARSRTRGKRSLVILANALEHYPIQWRASVSVR